MNSEEHDNFFHGTYAVPVCIFIIVIGFAIPLFFTENPLALDDGLRHIVMADQYREKGIEGVEGWGDYFFTGYFAQHNFDPWFLADLSYLPFTYFDDLVTGLKTANLLFLVVLLLSFFLLARFYTSSGLFICLLLSLLAFGSFGFSSRMLMGRPLTLMAALFLFTYFLIVSRRWLTLALALFLATLYSQLFVFPLILSLSASLVFGVFGRVRDALFCASASVAGVVVGILLHPQSAEYMRNMHTVFLNVGFSKSLGVGREFLSGAFQMDMGLIVILLPILLLCFYCIRQGTLRELVRRRPDIILSFLHLCALCFL